MVASIWSILFNQFFASWALLGTAVGFPNFKRLIISIQGATSTNMPRLFASETKFLNTIWTLNSGGVGHIFGEIDEVVAENAAHAYCVWM
jgi:hypothetical protein